MHPRTATADDLCHPDLVIRRAGDGDLARLHDLAALDSAAPLRGDTLLAFVGEELWAAVSLEDGRGVADPFRPSAAAAELLRVRARHLTGAWRPTRRAGALRAPGRSPSSP